MRIIGIGHKAEHGKDTLGIFLHECIPNSVLAAFATAPKEKAAEYTNESIEKFNTHEGKNEYLPQYDMTRRDILIKIAEEEKTAKGQDIWIDTLFEQVQQTISTLIITDVRFSNEADAIRKRGGILINVTRPGIPLSTRPSETALDNYTHWNYHILNNGSLEDLKEKSEVCVAQIHKNESSF